MQAPRSTVAMPLGASISSTALMVDSAWRALAYCLHPRVIYLSLLPLFLAALSLGLLGWFGWEPGVAAVRQALDAWGISHDVLAWLDRAGLSFLRTAAAPFLLVLMIVPLVIVLCLLLVAGLMTPSLVKLVRQRRFPSLIDREATPWWRSLLWSAGASITALALLVVSLPMWLVPIFAVLVPPVIWGWLTYRVMAFDTLVDVASPTEREVLLKRHHASLLGMGILCGYIGAAPAALWAMGALTVILAPLMVLLSVWLYTLVFAFSSLWFAHFLLSALQAQRQASSAASGSAVDTIEIHNGTST
ncbi:MAG TPA: EI24 domain-containing protein [Aquabacterium sp.]|uniref:EI24 domain-containing protein n=1 Tax=Aquabacterium sp. TaxID=1872578 RepID=UPI002E3371EA|nr:EI24 domain-containing protein [Aquabacterium sp.]HEX5357662.1 EI24 domain-containing protein [Aquabacterium sp.]